MRPPCRGGEGSAAVAAGVVRSDAVSGEDANEGEARDLRGWSASWRVGHRWHGEPLREAEVATVRARLARGRLVVEVDAPGPEDPPPPRDEGRCPGLWAHEVVELFLLGEDGRYLEVELGPHGHYLILELRGYRDCERDDREATAMSFTREGQRWRGRVEIDAAACPAGPLRANAYAIRGQGDARIYCAAFPGDGAPDFHRLSLFQPVI